MTVVQLATASLVAFAAMKPAGESVPPLTPALLGVALGLGIFSAIIQVTMNWAQRSVSPTRATLIYTGEPVWAGIFGRLAGERLPLLALLGCVFILAGVLVSELKWKRKPPPQMSTNDDAQPLPDWPIVASRNFTLLILQRRLSGWPTRPALIVCRPGKQRRRRAMESGTELRLYRVAAAPYPAYNPNSPLA